MHLKILKPDEVILDEDVSVVTLPTETGEISPLDGHEPLLTILAGGKVAYRPESSGEGERLAECEVGRGIAEITRHTVTLFVHRAGGLSYESGDGRTN